MTKRIVLCADDYGQAEALSSGILSLLGKGRLSAVSCLVNQPYWSQAAERLAPFHGQADIGLHLNFTDGEPLSSLYREKIGAVLMPLPQLLARAMLGGFFLNQEAIAAEITAQLDAFVAATGVMPTFIDGHLHVHHLPVIREALLAVYQAKLAGSGIYLRAVTQDWRVGDLITQGIKPAVIHYTGGGSFARRLDALGIPHNLTFAGVYPFNKALNYRDYFLTFLQQSADRGVDHVSPWTAS